MFILKSILVFFNISFNILTLSNNMNIVEKIIESLDNLFSPIIDYLLQFIQYERVAITASFTKALINLKRSSEIHFKTLILEFVISNFLGVLVGVVAIKAGISEGITILLTAVTAFTGSKVNDYLEKYVDIYLNNLNKKGNGTDSN